MSLREEALQVIEELDIMGLLRSYGKADVVGSVALDLIVKRDIDIHVLTFLQDPFGLVGEILPVLLDKKWARNLRVDKFTGKKAVKVALDAYPGPTGPWDIDIWITNEVSSTAFESTKILQEELTPIQRESIIEIKEYYHSLGVLRNGLSSRIYDAVVNYGVRTVQDFKNYLPRLSQST
jgi:hypothetical protein